MMSQETSDLVSGRNYHKVVIVTVYKKHIYSFWKRKLMVPIVYWYLQYMDLVLYNNISSSKVMLEKCDILNSYERGEVHRSFGEM